MISGRQKKISALVRLALRVLRVLACSAVQCTWSVGQIGGGSSQAQQMICGLTLGYEPNHCFVSIFFSTRS